MIYSAESVSKTVFCVAYNMIHKNGYEFFQNEKTGEIQ